MSNSTDVLTAKPDMGLKNLTSTSPVMGLSKGVRPEPEGEVSFRFPENLRTQQEKDSITNQDDSGLESDLLCLSSSCLSTNSHISPGQQPGSVHFDSHDCSSLSDLSPNGDLNQKDTEEFSSGLVQQVVNAATEEWKNQEPRDPCEFAGVSRPLEDGVQSDVQIQFQQHNSSDDSSRDPHQDTNSFRRKILSHLGSSVGEDSGCSSCFSEDASGAEGLTSDLSEEGQGILITPTWPNTVERTAISSIHREDEDEAWRGSAVKCLSCISANTQVSSAALTPPPALPIILWDIEVPAHLVGRLIGKEGKFVNFLKQSSGANIYVSTLPFTQDIQICHIQGTQQQVNDALSLIRKKFKDLALSNCVPLPRLPITTWLLLPQDVFVEVIVSLVEGGHHLFVLQHKHPSYQALSTLSQHMQLCYSQPGCPSLPTPVEVGVVCAAPVAGCGWQRAQVIQYDQEFRTAQIRYVDNGGYDTVNSATLRQIRSDFVMLPFQTAEVLLDNIMPLPGEVEFSPETKAVLKELTANVALILKVTGSQDGFPLVHIWKQTGDEMVLLNSLLAERGLCSWFDTL
ncbi:A-kinase anchor protein 1, mitochondrial-like [Myxocyprinus asiaticus]|uniref:A-kinase anchor protein 1, mitochondrial-like n=1 Tax=Myxocyprinus asiaticus TaxID=70543 RepID=UPI0022232DB5|nr:A-kinase anchor protein 1, mitochondrial-like [Myxocyprinus asiaticus]